MNNGPTTVRPEYVWIIRMRSFVKLNAGDSSALKTEGWDTPSSRATSALVLPVLCLESLANCAKSVSEYSFFIRQLNQFR